MITVWNVSLKTAYNPALPTWSRRQRSSIPIPRTCSLWTLPSPLETHSMRIGSSIKAHLLGLLSDHLFLCPQEAGCWHGCYGYRPGG